MKALLDHRLHENGQFYHLQQMSVLRAFPFGRRRLQEIVDSNRQVREAYQVMSYEYLPIGVIFATGLVVGLLFVGLSALIGRRPLDVNRISPYECGVDQLRPPRYRFTVSFFLIAMLFLLFDVEVTFLIPWAVLVRDFVAAGLGHFIVIEGLAFISVLVVGLIYVWRRGALEWER